MKLSQLLSHCIPTTPVGDEVSEGVQLGVPVSVPLAEQLSVLDEDGLADGVVEEVLLIDVVPVRGGVI